MSFFPKTLALLAGLVLMLEGAPLDTRESVLALNESQALEYLEKFGYLHVDSTGIGSLQDPKKAIAAFQLRAGLKPTGLLNQKTLRKMARPRCGFSDVEGFANRFKLSDSQWPKKDLTYFISKYPTGNLTRRQVGQVIAKALRVWSEHTDLTFRPIDRRLEDRPDIDIRFEDGEHGDGSSFDGEGGILGHAFFPAQGGETHFDNSEEWTLNDDNGIDLFVVAAHEFGHSLGLDHSQVPSALMAPFYQGYQHSFQLHSDDIKGIQKLYGPKIDNHQQDLPSDNSLCNDMSFDCIFTDLQKVTYVFKGTQYWELGSSVPKNVQRKWPGLPDKIDAAFSHRDIGKTYFFSGTHYWRYRENRLDQGYPKWISEGFPGIPDNLDAAFVSPKNNQIYFFKGSDYWRFDYTTLPAVAYEYPVPINAWWRRVPDALDAAFTREGVTYFVKGGSYAKISVDSFMIDSPESVSVLFGCPKKMGDREDPAWTAARDLKKSHFSEGLRRPAHERCIKHQKCSQFP